MIESEHSDDYYRRRVLEEIADGEPELALLTTLITSSGTAVDVGANQGIYAFALSEIGQQVHAFEAHPDYAKFAKDNLGDRATVHTVALTNAKGRAKFYVPYSDDGMELHFAGNLKNSHAQFTNQKIIETDVETLDSFALTGVTFIKVDVEGSELDVLEGARRTILRDKPVLLLELLSGTYPDPSAITQIVCDTYGYKAFVVDGIELHDAIPTIRALNANTTWGSTIKTRNVLFKPRA